MVNDQTLRGELAEMDRRIRELKGARHAITRDLEWALKEQDRLKRHLNTKPDERGGIDA